MAPVVAVVVSAFLAPVVLLVLQGRQRRSEKRDDAEIRAEEKREDWARQDEVAARLTAAQAATTLQVTEVAASAQSQLQSIDTQIGEVHTLVNQKLTDVTARALAAYETLLQVLERGSQDTDALELIKSTEDAVKELKETLTVREQTQKKVDDARA